MRWLRWFLLVALAGAVLATRAASFLIINSPEKSDAIVVLAGETNVRPAKALELLRQGMAPRAIFDAEAGEKVYDKTLTSLAENYLKSVPEAGKVEVCAINGRSTMGETDDVARCLAPYGVHRVLLVTSEYHTRRALTTFRYRLPQYHWSVAAAGDSALFGTAWWTQREWAKGTFEEWTKLIWWEVVDRWR